MKVLRSGPSYVGGDDSQDTMCNLGDGGREGSGQEALTAPGGKALGKEGMGVVHGVRVRGRWECDRAREGSVLTHVEIECSLQNGRSRYVSRSRA